VPINFRDWHDASTLLTLDTGTLKGFSFLLSKHVFSLRKPIDVWARTEVRRLCRAPSRGEAESPLVKTIFHIDHMPLPPEIPFCICVDQNSWIQFADSENKPSVALRRNAPGLPGVLNPDSDDIGA
jgi:hypothetical protein